MIFHFHTVTSGDAFEGPATLMAARLEGGGSATALLSLLYDSVSDLPSNELTTLEMDFLSEIISFVHLS